MFLLTPFSFALLQQSYEGVLEVLLPFEERDEEEGLHLENLAQALHAFNETASALASMYAGMLVRCTWHALACIGEHCQYVMKFLLHANHDIQLCTQLCTM